MSTSTVRTYTNADSTIGVTIDDDGVWIAQRIHRSDAWGPPEQLTSRDDESRLVVNMESEPPEVIGTYHRTEEDSVLYVDLAGQARVAPEDCVDVMSVDEARARGIR
jgi:hypothetical protein